ncbi:MAG: hypothetical protein MZV70_20985 [Desulfobacterales bacterium]|nr:hypothetical protein [Desulfobacterales bacterium]
MGQLAQAFNRMAESLEKIQNLRRNLMIDVAHELRTPAHQHPRIPGSPQRRAFCRLRRRPCPCFRMKPCGSSSSPRTCSSWPGPTPPAATCTASPSTCGWKSRPRWSSFRAAFTQNAIRGERPRPGWRSGACRPIGAGSPACCAA